MLVEVWSDVVCPFCAIGRKNLQIALDGYGHADEVSVRWRSFQLDPTPGVAGEPGSMAAGLAKKFGMSLAEAEANQEQLRQSAAQIGLDFRWDLVRPSNTFDAHRLAHIVGDIASDRADAVVDGLFTGYFTEGVALTDHEALVDIAVQAGVPADEVRTALSGHAGAAGVEEDLAQARAYGISAVPFFVINQTYGVSGAQPPEVLTAAFEEAREAAA